MPTKDQYDDPFISHYGDIVRPPLTYNARPSSIIQAPQSKFHTNQSRYSSTMIDFEFDSIVNIPSPRNSSQLQRSNSHQLQRSNSHQLQRSNSQRPSLLDLYVDTIPLKESTRSNSIRRDQKGGTIHRSRPVDINAEDDFIPRSKSTSKKKKKKLGLFAGKIPWFVYIISLVQITVFVVEIIQNSIITGSPIMIHPQFNPMIGPSIYVQINMGARFVPCMRTTPGVQDGTVPINWPCPNTTTSNPDSPSNHCDLNALCGLNGVNNDNPNQWFRFITPMFLHAGIIHIGFNMLLQLTMGREMEQSIGTLRFALVYLSSGIFGFVLGGNFAATAIASTGASGSLFGILALVLLDLIYCWNERPHPIRDLMWILADILISFVLGLLPGLDNFSHIGGFLMGLAAGICFLHSPNILRQRIDNEGSLSYRNMESEMDFSNTKRPTTAMTTTTGRADVTAFTKEPVGFFKGRKPLWWAWWLLRAGALIGVLVAFIVLLNNFYMSRETCSWCKYLTCLPINHWCDLGNLQLRNATTTSNNQKRELLRSSSVLVSELWDRAGMH